MAHLKEAGAAATEMLLALVPTLLLVLGIMQLAQIGTAGLLVQHAAFCAARSAVVVLPEGDRPVRPDEDPPPPDATPNRMGPAGPPTSDLSRAAAGWSSSPRFATVARAAAFVMTAVSPPLRGGDSVADALDGRALASGAPGAMGLVGRAVQKAAHARAATAVVFVDAPGSERYVTSFSPTGPVSVRVTHLFRCGIPLAARVLCRRWAELPDRARREVEAVASPQRSGLFAALVAEAQMRNEGLP